MPLFSLIETLLLDMFKKRTFENSISEIYRALTGEDDLNPLYIKRYTQDVNKDDFEDIKNKFVPIVLRALLTTNTYSKRKALKIVKIKSWQELTEFDF